MALGMSVGTTNLVAAAVGHQPVLRRAVLTRSGVALTGFVERVGDPVPLVAADGMAYAPEQLVVEALDDLAAQAMPAPPSEVAIAVPSYWGSAALAALTSALEASGTSRVLAPGGAPPRPWRSRASGWSRPG